MPTKPFEAHIRYVPHIAIIDLYGEINAQAEEILNTVYQEAEQQQCPSILLNFTHVAYINSTGIALIVSLLTRARNARRELLACGLSEHYVEIFRITRLVDFMRVYPDEETVLAQHRSPAE